MRRLICTRTATGLTVEIEGADITVSGRDEGECFAEILKRHAAQLDIGITYVDAPTATTEHLAAVLRGDRDAVYGPQALRPLLLALAVLQPEMVLRGMVDSREMTVGEWATKIREMDVGEPCFLKRAEAKGPRQLQIIMQKMVLWNEVTTNQTPGYQAPSPPRPATAARRKR